jgi:hypothetical protein
MNKGEITEAGRPEQDEYTDDDYSCFGWHIQYLPQCYSHTLQKNVP